MKWLRRLEGPLGFLAIPNLMLFIVAGQAITTLVALKDPTLPMQLWLDPAAVGAGQWWRTFTWVIVPATSPLSVLLAVFWFMFLWAMGRALEAEWGAFLATLYILLGIALPSAGCLILWQWMGMQTLITGFYFSASMQLAFAALAPEHTIYLMGLLPIKMKWWGYAIIGYLLWQAFQSWPAGAVQGAFGVGNFILFFLPQAVEAWKLRKLSVEGKKVFAEARKEVAIIEARRACTQCQRGPEADLRLCTCAACGEDGRFWCMDHLSEHLRSSAPPPDPVPKKSGKVPAPKKKRKA